MLAQTRIVLVALLLLAGAPAAAQTPDVKPVLEIQHDLDRGVTDATRTVERLAKELAVEFPASRCAPPAGYYTAYPGTLTAGLAGPVDDGLADSGGALDAAVAPLLRTIPGLVAADLLHEDIAIAIGIPTGGITFPSPPAEVRYVVAFGGAPTTLQRGDTYLGATVVHADSYLNFVSVEFPTAQLSAFNEQLARQKNVRYCEDDPTVQFLDPVEPQPSPISRGLADAVGPSTGQSDGPVGTLATIPNDPLYPQQYGPAKMNMPTAWDTTLGTTGRNLCIVDSGVRYTHQDLAGSRWLGGYDYVNGDSDPWDDHGHGTHVTGTAAATTNNAVGVAGMSQTGFFQVKVINSANQGQWSWLASAIAWCVNNGGDIISMSLGGNGGAQIVADAVTDAWNQGHLLIASAGNDGGAVGFPAAYPEVIAVACTDQSDLRCLFSGGGASNVGPEVELAAPGMSVISSTYSSDSSYGLKSGTSMSAPHVAGVAALMWNHVPSLSNAQVRAFLQCTALDLGAAGKDNFFGFGLVNAAFALDRAIQGSCACAPSTLNLTGVFNPSDPIVNTGAWQGTTTMSLALGAGRSVTGPATMTWSLYYANGYPGPYNVFMTEPIPNAQWTFTGADVSYYLITFSVSTACTAPFHTGAGETLTQTWVQFN